MLHALLGDVFRTVFQRDSHRHTHTHTHQRGDTLHDI